MYQQLHAICDIEKVCAVLKFSKSNLTQQLMHALKYQNKQNIGRELAKITMQNIKKNSFDFDVIVPIPIHAKKHKKRGYNQVHSFAKQLSLETNLPLDLEVLKRTEYNKSQVYKNKQERLDSLQNSFVLGTNHYKQKHILLVDDVMTTGATLGTCAKLFNQENTKVSVLVMACVI